MPQPIQKIPSSLPVTQKSQSCGVHSKCIIIVIVVFLIGFLTGMYLGKTRTVSVNTAGQSVTEVKNTYDSGYKTAMDLARQKMEKKGMFFNVSDKGTSITRALVKSVDGNNVSVEIDASLLDFFADGMITKTITVNNDTKIEKLIPKSMEQYNKDQEEFRKYIEEARGKEFSKEDKMIQPPSPYDTKELKVSELKAGDYIGFYGNANLNKTDSIEVSKITITVEPEMKKDVKMPAENSSAEKIDDSKIAEPQTDITVITPKEASSKTVENTSR